MHKNRKIMPRRLSFRVLPLFLLLLLCVRAKAQWDYEIPFPKPLQKEDTVSVSFIGDMMMHSRQLEYDYHDFLNGIDRVTRGSDISVANLEFTLAGRPYTGYPAFSSPDGYASYAADCGIDVFLTANNHILDKGTRGLERTVKVYEALADSCGVKYTGTALDEASDSLLNPLIVVGHGIRLALVNFTYGTNMEPGKGWPKVKLMDRESVGKMFRRAREKGADFIIALPHWGTEYRLRHSKEQEEWAEWLVEQGADIIIGTHPHVVQDTTHIDKVPVIYSLGNSISNMSAVNTRLGLAVTARFVRHSNGTAGMLEPELEFMWCTLPGRLRETYSTILVKDYTNRRDEWITPSDYDEMMSTYRRVTKETGIAYEEDSQAGSR